MARRKKNILISGLCILAAGSNLAYADSVTADSVTAPTVTVSTALEDTKLYFTAPLRWDSEDWLAFGATLALLGTAHEFDQRVRSHFVTPADAALNGRDTNSIRDALPVVALVAGTGLGAAFYRDPDGYEETWRLLEAGLFSSATAEVLSYAAGRERPDATSSPNQWRQGGDSFPSLHASAAFAVGAVFAESGNDEYRWLRRIVGYGVAGAIGYVRIRNNDHWLSDTVAGAALGLSTARFVLNRQDQASRAQFALQPAGGGWQLCYSIKTR